MIAVQDGVNISVLVLGIQMKRRIQGQSPSRAITDQLEGTQNSSSIVPRPKAKEASLTVPLSILNREV
jgi:hypothetical protein